MTELEDRLAVLKGRFLDRCREDLAVVDTALAHPEALDREQVRATVHRLAGAAGTFGYAELSRIAGEADDAIVVGQETITPELKRVSSALHQTVD